MPERAAVVNFTAGALAGACVAGATAYAIAKASRSKPQPVLEELKAPPEASSSSSREAKLDDVGGSQASRSVPQTAPPSVPDDQDKPDDAPEECPGVSSESAGKSASCAGCPNQKLCASGEAKKPDPAVSDVAERLSNVKRKILVLSGKGGVGKSTISAQLSFGFAAREMDVGLLDVDICGPSVPRMLGGQGQDVHQSGDGWQPVYVSDRLAVMSIGFMLPNQDDAIIWRGPRKNGLIKQFLTDVNWGPLDCLFIDTPPGTSDEHLSIVTYLQEASLDGAVIVTTPQEVALMDVRKEINFCKKVNLPVIGVVENMSGFVCPSCGHEETIFAPTTGGAEGMCTSMGVPFLGKVPLDGRVAKAGDSGMSLAQLQPDGPVAKAIDNIIDKILKHTTKG